MKLLVILSLIFTSSIVQEEKTGDNLRSLVGEWVPVKGSNLSAIGKIIFYPNGLINIESREVKLVQGYRVTTKTSPYKIEVTTGSGNVTPISSFTIDFNNTSEINLYYKGRENINKLVLRKVKEIKSGFIPLMSANYRNRSNGD